MKGRRFHISFFRGKKIISPTMRHNLWGKEGGNGSRGIQSPPFSHKMALLPALVPFLGCQGGSVFVPLLRPPAVLQGQQGAGCWCGNQSLTTTHFTEGHRQPSDVDDVEWLLTLFLASADINWSPASLHQLKVCLLMVVIILIFRAALRVLQLLRFTSLALIWGTLVFWCYL